MAFGFRAFSEAAFSDIAAPAAETTLVSKHVSKLDTPRILPRALIPAILAGFCFTPIAPPPAPIVPSVDGRTQPLSLPTPGPRALIEAARHSFAATMPFQPPPVELVTVDKYWQPLSLPVRRAPSLLDAAKPQVFASFADPFPEDIKISSWFRPLDTPVRAKPHPYPPTVFGAPVVTIELVTVDKWHTPFSQPYFTKTLPVTHRLPLSGYSPLPVVPFTPQALSQPYVPKTLPAAHRSIFAAASPLPVVPFTPQPLSQPYFTKLLPVTHGLPLAAYHPQPVVPFMQQPLSQPYFPQTLPLAARLFNLSADEDAGVATEPDIETWFRALELPTQPWPIRVANYPFSWSPVTTNEINDDASHICIAGSGSNVTTGGQANVPKTLSRAATAQTGGSAKITVTFGSTTKIKTGGSGNSTC